MAVETKDWIELAKLAQRSFQNRRAIEWKLAFGLWTAIGAFTAFFAIDGPVYPHWFPWVLRAVYFLVMIGVVFFWQYPMHDAHAGDREWFFYYTDKAQGYVPPGKNELSRPGERHRWNWRNWYWCVGQCLFTLTFLILSWIVITQTAPMKRSQLSGTQEPRASGQAH